MTVGWLPKLNKLAWQTGEEEARLEEAKKPWWQTWAGQRGQELTSSWFGAKPAMGYLFGGMEVAGKGLRSGIQAIPGVGPRVVQSVEQEMGDIPEWLRRQNLWQLMYGGQEKFTPLGIAAAAGGLVPFGGPGKVVGKQAMEQLAKETAKQVGKKAVQKVVPEMVENIARWKVALKEAEKSGDALQVKAIKGWLAEAEATIPQKGKIIPETAPEAVKPTAKPVEITEKSFAQMTSEEQGKVIAARARYEEGLTRPPETLPKAPELVSEGIKPPEGKPLTEGGMPPPAKPPPPTAEMTLDDADEIIKSFKKAISSPEAAEAWKETKSLRTTIRAQRFKAFRTQLEKLVNEGVDVDVAIERATGVLRGKLPLLGSSIGDSPEIRKALFTKLYQVLKSAPEGDVLSTATALENALKTGNIPRELGVKGGSAYTRLVKVFGKDIVEAIEKPEKLFANLPSNPMTQADRDALDALLQVPTKPFGQAELWNTPSTLQYEEMRPFAQQMIDRMSKGLFKKLSKPELTAILQQMTPSEQLVFRQLARQRGLIPTEQVVMELMTDISKGTAKLEQLALIPPSARSKLITVLQKIGMNVLDFFGIPKTTKFMLDQSFMFRQLGKIGAGHPVSWGKTWKYYSKAMASEKVAVATDNMIRTDPARMDAIQFLGLDRYLYDVKKTATYWGRPETMASKIAQKYIPGARMSERGAAVASNFMLTDVGKTLTQIMKRAKASPDEGRAMGSLLGDLIGRTELPNVLRGTAGDIINKWLTSPRYWMSTFKIPGRLFSKYKSVRQEAAKDLMLWVSFNAAVLGMGKLMGFGVEGDPRSSDVIKLKIGNKRIDLWAGTSQIIRLAAQLATGSRKTEEGKIAKVPREQVIKRYLQSKEAPGVGAIITLLSGVNYIGEKIDFTTVGGWGKYAKESFLPTILEEIADAYALEGVGSAVTSGAASWGGIGVSTYAPSAPTLPKGIPGMGKLPPLPKLPSLPKLPPLPALSR